MKPLILCLGNEVLSDDGFGFVVADRLRERPEITAAVDVEAAAAAGFALLDLLNFRKRVLIVDTIRTEAATPGTLHEFPAGQFTPTKNLTTSHQISLPQALELGNQLGYTMPTSIDILAVEAEDLETLSESLTPAVRGAVNPAVGRVELWINSIPDILKEKRYATELP